MDYSEKKLIELKYICSQRGVKNYRRMGKSKLIEMLVANDEDPTALKVIQNLMYNVGGYNRKMAEKITQNVDLAYRG